jgi:enediyne biosynthesis protein E4
VISRRELLRILGASALAHPSLATLSAHAAGDLPAFEEIPATRSGIVWTHESGPSPDMYLPETTGAGCAFFDYDNDGWMDIYLVNSGPCDFYKPRVPLRNALYRNNRNGTFTDVTEKAGVPGNAYGMGVAVGDYDGDGLPDLYISQYPRSILYHNNGDGTFTDVTEKAGVSAPGMSTSAVWFDYDNDGRLDLFVSRFGNFEKATNIACMSGAHTRVYCKPTPYLGKPCWLFHNNGDGTFTDVSVKSGIAASPAKAWGVVAADINNDGWMDLFVSNDTLPNFLFANRRGHFEEIGLLAGVGLSNFGLPRSGMGVDAADYDQDGWIDLCVSNVDHEQYSLYHNEKNETFSDLAAITRIGAATKLLSGWGMKFFDFDNDGNLDLLLANGHPDPSVEQRFPELRYAEPMLLFKNEGNAWRNISLESGPIFSKPLAARGLALGDFDNDGSVDVLLTQNDGPPVLLRNNAARNQHWLGVRLVGTTANKDAIGAKLTYAAGNLQRHIFKVGSGSYLSSHDPRMVLGLGANAKIDWLEIKWPKPSDRVERFINLPVDRYVTIVEGQPNWK